jgi:hypothetical protein
MGERPMTPEAAPIATVGETRLGPPLRELIEALGHEIRAARDDPARTFEVRAGRRLLSKDEQHLYAFRAEVALPIPPETPVKLLIPPAGSASGLLVAQQDFEVVLLLREDVGEEVGLARVAADPWFIAQALSERLREELERAAGDLEIPLALLGLEESGVREDPAAAAYAQECFAKLGVPALVPNAAQLAAVGKCAGSRLHFVWGPPGTGKTANVAQVVRALVANSERVLVLAHANAAVDVAMLRVADAFAGTGELREGRILRIGVPQLPEAQGRAEILPEEVIARRQPDLVARKRALEGRRHELLRRLHEIASEDRRAATASQLEAVRAELAGIREALRMAMETLVREARVIGTTLSRLVTEDRVWSWPADAVVVDETSMAPFPAVAACALRARKRLLLFGDFRQLPPICVASTPLARRWLARDAFEVAGVRERVDAGKSEPRVSLLDVQYRMAGPIAEVVSRFAYGGKLRSEEAAHAAPGQIEVGSWPGEAVVLVDTSRLASVCLKEPKAGSHSRANPLHALLAISLAERATRSGETGIALVSPYRAQARLLAVGAPGPTILGATVHRFQGSERDVVLFDLVDSEPQSSASQLTGKDADTAFRLLNVAISRARAQLIVLANVTFVERRHPRSSPARTLIRSLAAMGRLERLEPTTLGRWETDSITWYPGWPEAQGAIAAELRRSPRATFVNLPETFQPSEDLLDGLRRLSSGSGHVTVFAPVDVATRLEDSKVDLRLMVRPGGFFALLDGRIAFVGGASPVGPVGRVVGEGFAEVLGRLLLGPAAVAPAPSAEAEAAMARVGGRCGDCGGDRRPRRAAKGHWVLGCGTPGHQAVPLDRAALAAVAEALEVRCIDCGERAVAREAAGRPFLGCPRFGRGCPGRVPNLDDLFSGA